MTRIILVILAAAALYWFLPDQALALAVYLGAVSLVTFAAFGLDKFCAVRGLRRIPEDVLLILAGLGGTLGAFAGQSVFRHKTHKPYINRALIVIFILQTVIITGCSLAVIKNS